MKNTLIRVLAMLLVCVLLLPTFVACHNDDNNDDNTQNTTPPEDDPQTPPTADIVKIEMSASASQIKAGETVQVTARVTGAKNTQVTWSVSHPDVVSVDADGLVSMVGEITIDTIITVTATSVENPTVKATKTLIAKAPMVDGRVGELTSDMLVAVGNPSITVNGTVTDVYNDINTPANSSETMDSVAVSVHNNVDGSDYLMAFEGAAWSRLTIGLNYMTGLNEVLALHEDFNSWPYLTADSDDRLLVVPGATSLLRVETDVSSNVTYTLRGWYL